MSHLVQAQTRRNTIAFNTYFWLQFFNISNCRRVDDGFNVFEGVTRNKFFFLVILLAASGQVLIIFVGGKAFGVIPLNSKEWGVSLGFGVLSLPCGMLVRMVPDHWLRDFGKLALGEYLWERLTTTRPQLPLMRAEDW